MMDFFDSYNWQIKIKGSNMSLTSFLKSLRLSYVTVLTLISMGLVACSGGDGGSAAVPPGTTYVVSSLADSGTGSLRAAITSVNSAPSSQYLGISFSVTGVITLASDLPAITNKVLIDGTTAPGYSAGNTTTAPLVAVNFNGAGSGFNFNSGSAGSGIYGLSIIGSNSNGVTLNVGSLTLLSNYIGLNLSGTAAPNAANGIYMSTASTNNVVGSNPKSISGLYSNVISGNTLHGIQLYGSAGNQIQANAIGTNPAGTTAIGNGGNGIYITHFAAENTIGGTAYINAATGDVNNPTGNKGTVPIVSIAPPLGNLISGNSLNGVLIDDGSELTVLSGNFIGTNNEGNSAIGNALDGVLIRNANNNQLIGCTFEDNPFIYYNVLSGNGGNGLHVANSNAILIQANFFGVGANNASMVPNGLHGILVDGASAGVQVGGVIPLGNVSAANKGDGVRVSGTVSGFTSFNTFVGLYAFQGAASNDGNGIAIDATGGNNLIRTSVTSGNKKNGIMIFGAATGVTVDPNISGLNTEGNGPLINPPVPGFGNGGSGVLITGTASGNFIGGYNGSVIPQNTFSGNAEYGIKVDELAGTGVAGANYIFNSVIGLSTSMLNKFGNGLGGIYLGAGTRDTYIGPFTAPSTTAGTGNVISGNTGYGLILTAGSTSTISPGATLQDGNCNGCGRLVRDGDLIPDVFPNTSGPVTPSK
jgi:parallel beta-helix repeat protein